MELGRGDPAHLSRRALRGTPETESRDRGSETSVILEDQECEYKTKGGWLCPGRAVASAESPG
jgi:hypothetical protein